MINIMRNAITKKFRQTNFKYATKTNAI